MHYVIIHGSFGNPQDNWFPYLKTQLELKDHSVTVPAFPIEDWDDLTSRGESVIANYQNVKNWLDILEPLIPEFKSKPTVFIGHSIGCLFILHAVSHFSLQTSGAIFIAPFLTKLNKAWQIDTVNASFYKEDFDFEQLKKLIPRSTAFYALDDPYVDPEYSQTFIHKIGSKEIRLLTGGHLNARSGYITFPQLLAECLAYA